MPENVDQHGFADSNLERFYKNRKEITLPKNLAQNIVSGINFALRTGSAQKINGVDLYHVHACVPIEEALLFSNKDESLPATKTLIEKLSDNPKTVLLFHTQELVKYQGTQRSVITDSKGKSVFSSQWSQLQEPYKKAKFDFKFENDKIASRNPIQPIFLGNKHHSPITSNNDTTDPVDLNMFSPLQLGFIVIENGGYTLENNQKIDIFVY